MSRFDETLRTIPPTTLGIIALCLSLYAIQVVAEMPPLSAVTFCPRLVLYQGQVYRIVTSALYHASLMHIGMNLMSTAAIAAMLEARLGTLRLACTILLSTFVSAFLYMAAAIVLVCLGHVGLMDQHSVGFSGVIFHLSVLECNLHGRDANRSVFGLFQVPAYAYPWVLLVVLQLFMPELSFAGHLSGIVAGTLQLYGFLDCFMPSETRLLQMDDWNCVRRLKMVPSFVATTNYCSLTLGNNVASLRGAVSARFGSIAQRVSTVLRSNSGGPSTDLTLSLVASSDDKVSEPTVRLPTSHIV